MAEKKTGSARRPSKGDDDSSAKKKQSGTQKSLKKTSARKPATDDEDDAPPKKRGSARTQRGDSARAGGGPVKQGPDAGRIFLYFVPGVILVLLGLGYYVATLPDAKPPEQQTISFDGKVAEAKKMYVQAKAAYEAGSSQEGAAGLPKLKEAKKLLEDASGIIQKVREDLDALDEKQKSDPNFKIEQGKTADLSKGGGYQFDYDEQQINQLLVMCRKAILERE